MRKLESRILWGVLLIAVGILFLLQSLGLIRFAAVIWPVLIGVASLAFLFVFFSAPQANWWAAIPGFVLLGVSGVVALDQLAPQVGETWGGSLFLGGIALAFWVIYLFNPAQWWAVIPGGVLVTLALVAGLSPFLEGVETGGVFFLGLGLTFALLALLPTPEGRLTWSIIPAIVLLIVGALVTAAAAELINYVWPALLILGGLYLLVRAFGSR
ncbi:MAG: hypothetical protein R6X31_06380 [Anaerolineae bacterium]